MFGGRWCWWCCLSTWCLDDTNDEMLSVQFDCQVLSSSAVRCKMPNCTVPDDFIPFLDSSVIDTTRVWYAHTHTHTHTVCVSVCLSLVVLLSDQCRVCSEQVLQSVLTMLDCCSHCWWPGLYAPRLYYSWQPISISTAATRWLSWATLHVNLVLYTLMS